MQHCSGVTAATTNTVDMAESIVEEGIVDEKVVDVEIVEEICSMDFSLTTGQEWLPSVYRMEG